LRTELPIILATRSDVLSPRMMRIIEDLAGDWRRLNERIEGLSVDIASLVERDSACERLMTVPGIGPIISSAMVAAIGTGDVFSKGRDFAAWLAGAPADLDRRPHHPRENIKTWQSATCASCSCRRPGWC
jgi:transposase